MGNSDEIKIRVLPRGSEKKPAKLPVEKKPSRLIIYVGTTSAVLLGVMFYLPGPTRHSPVASQSKKLDKNSSKTGQMTLMSVSPAQQDPVNKHLREVQLQHDTLVRKRVIENQQLETDELSNSDTDQMVLPAESASNGVRLDTDGAAERVYDDLNDNPVADLEMSPAERISFRLANKKWVTELERRERIQFVSNFIRSARDQGYNVEIDKDLVVVGVSKINETRKVSIESVIDKLANEGL